MLANIDWSLYLLAAVAITLAPGPDNLFVMAIGIAQGRRDALALASGLALGNIGHTLAVTLGVAVLLATYPPLFTGVKMAGVLYLSWLALKAWHTPILGENSGATAHQSPLRWFRRGIIMNLLNPKVALFFIAFLPPFVPAESKQPALATLALGGVFIVQTFILFGTIAIIASTLGRWWRAHPAAERWGPRLTATILAALAVTLLLAQLPG